MSKSANGFPCPACGDDTRIIDSRQVGEVAKRRRRKCTSCSERFTTYELTATEVQVLRGMAGRSKTVAMQIAAAIEEAINRI